MIENNMPLSLIRDLDFEFPNKLLGRGTLPLSGPYVRRLVLIRPVGFGCQMFKQKKR